MALLLAGVLTLMMTLAGACSPGESTVDAPVDAPGGVSDDVSDDAPPEAGKPGANKTPDAIHKTITRGPVTVDLDIDNASPTIADQINLCLSVEFDENWDVTLPAMGEKLDPFGIVSYHTDPPELIADSRSRIRRCYVLEPFLSGEYTIRPMTIKFQDLARPDDPEHKIETEAVTLEVKSLLPENFEELTLHDIHPPVPLPRSYTPWIWAGGGLAVLLAAGIVGAGIWQRKRRHGSAGELRQIPPHEQAFAELQALVDENLVEKGEVKAFYQKISNILRHYIENRFHLKAPEQTTEEFLAVIRSDNSFGRQEKALLQAFLTHCDLVKFAKFAPATEDIQKTFDACKAFILETREKETAI